LYEMLAGKTPFDGDYDSAVVYAILNEKEEPVSRWRPDVSPGLAAAVHKALEKDPEMRYQHMVDLVADLKREQLLFQKTDRPAQRMRQPSKPSR